MYIRLSLFLTLWIWCYSYQLIAANFFPVTVADLIADITTANGNGQDDVIDLNNAVFTLNLSNYANDLNDGINGLPSILSDTGHTLTIQNGTILRDLSLSNNPADGENFRLLHISTGASLILNGIILQNGLAGAAGAGNAGGALYNRGTLQAINTTFTGNNAEDCGAIANFIGTITSLNGCVFSDNNAITGLVTPLNGGYGGAIFSFFGDIQDIVNTTFDGNTATQDGGAIFNQDNTIDIIENSTFSNNSAGVNGGAIMNISMDSEGASSAVITTIINTTFYNNTATAGEGGAIANSSTSEGLISSISNIYNTTITHNSAGLEGGGIANMSAGGSVITNLVSTIVAANTSPTGPDIHDPSGNITNESFNLIGNNNNSMIVAGSPNGNQSYVGTNVSPIAPGLSTLANNGGPTKTCALLIGSIAIDHGSNPDAVSFDQRGSPYLRTVNGATDIGAFERQEVNADKFQFVPGACQFTQSPLTATVGETVYYEITVANNSNTSLTFTINDPGCDPNTIVPASLTSNLIPPGESTTFTCRHKITVADFLATSFTNQATFTATPLIGPPLTPIVSNPVVVFVPTTRFSMSNRCQL